MAPFPRPGRLLGLQAMQYRVTKSISTADWLANYQQVVNASDVTRNDKQGGTANMFATHNVMVGNLAYQRQPFRVVRFACLQTSCC
jgi:hypothetical protein